MALSKLLEIPIGRGCTLMLYPSELRQGLSQEYWEKGLRRGKAVRRRRLQRLREGDKVVVSLGSGECEAEIINADDPAKLKVKLLNTGSEVWIGRRCVVDLVT